jgi:7-cyano-7-deazaguanine synthase
MKPTCVALFSGGLDSGVMVHGLLAAGERVLAMGYGYGTKHNRHELRAAENLYTCLRDRYPGRIIFRVKDLERCFVNHSGPMFVGDQTPLPEGHFQDESMKATVVPGRNLIFAAVAASVAEAEGANRIYLGAHAGDHAVYPDCRPDFLKSLYETVRLSTEGRVMVFTPFVGRTKADIVKYGLSIQFPFHLTRTCYSANPTACGRCGACVERRAAFMSAGVVDPLPYEYTGPLPEKKG